MNIEQISSEVARMTVEFHSAAPAEDRSAAVWISQAQQLWTVDEVYGCRHADAQSKRMK